MNLPKCRTPTTTLAIAFLFFGSFLVTIAPTSTAATTRVFSITDGTVNNTVPFQTFDGNPPKLFDIDGDGDLEIIAQNDNQYVYIFDSRNGKMLAEFKTKFPAGWGARSFNGPEVAIMSQGGSTRVIVANSAAYITSYRFDAAGSTSTSFRLVKEWERRLTDCYAGSAMDSKPVLADLDKDGRFEILASTENLGVYALRDDGRIYWKTCIGGGNAEPTVGDLNQDSWPDVVFGSDAGVVTAMNGRTGSTMWTFRTLDHFDLHSASMPVGVAIGQLDGVGGLDVVAGARDSHDPNNWSNDHALLLALDSSGRKLWGKQDPIGNPLTYTHPVIADADKDGQAEVYWGDWNTIGHKPPADEEDAWKRTGSAHFYRYDRVGNMVWRQTLGTFWSNKDVPIADVDGDGVQEMLANGPASNGHDGIWYLDVRTGAKEAFVDLYPWQLARAPVVEDLWDTDTMQWVVPVGPYASGVSHAILVYDTGAPYSAVWPHLPYPTLGTPQPDPEPTGEFAATFTIKSPGQWWQEVFVKPATSRTITKVEIRKNGDFWRPMELRSWGGWTSSIQTPAGTTVEFLATDSGGAVSQSAPFTWMDGTLTKGSVPRNDPDPEPTPFVPTFEVPPSVNEWWVEVKVRATDPLSGVDARVNSGAWMALSATSWETWAKSIGAPRGSQVQFRATNVYGQQATSQTFTWLSDSNPGFTATFEPKSQTNNWWVEVKVTSASDVQSVDAQVDNGAWTSLPKTGWGTWAKSFFVADGAAVKFRATNDIGNTAESGVYIWG